MKIEDLEPVAWVSNWSLKRIAANNGVLSMLALDERLSRLANNVQDVPLYTAAQIEQLLGVKI